MSKSKKLTPLIIKMLEPNKFILLALAIKTYRVRCFPSIVVVATRHKRSLPKLSNARHGIGKKRKTLQLYTEALIIRVRRKQMHLCWIFVTWGVRTHCQNLQCFINKIAVDIITKTDKRRQSCQASKTRTGPVSIT